MADIVGGTDVLSKRLESLSQQSLEIKRHMEPRARAYLQESSSSVSSSLLFVLPDSHDLEDLVHKEAFHLWAKREGYALSYGQLQRVCHQLKGYPDRQQWSLQVGNGWNVQRNGRMLGISRQDEEEVVEDVTMGESNIVWSIVHDDNDKQPLSSSQAHHDTTSPSFSGLFIHMKEIPTSGFRFANGTTASTWRFTPSWRAGHSSIKVKDFLRGQKVPLHLRREARVLYHGDDETPSVVAICSTKRGDWVVDARYSTKGKGTQTLQLTVE
eukprot:CAMPEP_0116839432 /NCGR_PEP_ID=MMETSP0418-20121206/9766_1 /TAXON_ID=1158023 /ORGANISM="Astrosyne radiata, Strain 13vi08-1A" /LENGTH=268 /DNA_ID=CAMNT_0004469547 /DNA_START=15 /DNA_END=821 /DNA_ORIENTATION=-